MKRSTVRRLSPTEEKLVDAFITRLCEYCGLSAKDEDYRHIAWEYFWLHYVKAVGVPAGNFWPLAARSMREALLDRTRDFFHYQTYSMDMPIGPDTSTTILAFLPSKQGDFTKRLAFRDYLSRQTKEESRLATRLMDGETFEEARSGLGWSDSRLHRALTGLRAAMEAYENI